MPKPKLSTLRAKIKAGKKLGFTERASAKARGLIKRADGTKRKSAKYRKRLKKALWGKKLLGRFMFLAKLSI